MANVILNGHQPVLPETPKVLRPPERGLRMYRAKDGAWWCLHPDGKQHLIHNAAQMRAFGDG